MFIGYRRLKETLKRGSARWLKEYKLIVDIWKGRYPLKQKKISLSILEKISMTLIIFVRSLSLVNFGNFLRSYKASSEFSEFYVLGWLILSIWLLWNPFLPALFLYLIIGYRLIDGLNYRLSIIFVDRYQPSWGLRSLNRSLILLLLNYCEIIFGFAILYLNSSSIGYSSTTQVIQKPAEALYFSVVTITTLGYGDMRPITSVGRGLALLEPLFGFILVALVIGVFLTGVRDITELDGSNLKEEK
jgi:hypothetical protein